MWTTTAASQYGSTTAWWTSHRRQALTTSVQSRDKQTLLLNTCNHERAASVWCKFHWVESILQYLKKKETNPPTWHIWTSKYFSAVEAVFRVDLPVWSIIRWLQPGINIPTSEVHLAFFSPLLLLSYAHGVIENHPAQDPELVSTFHVALGNGKNRMDGQHTCKHMLREKMGLVTHYNTFSA